MKTFSCTVVASDTSLFSGNAWQVIVEGLSGKFGLRAGHAPLICSLTKSRIEVAMTPEQRKQFSISGGLLEFTDDRCTIVVEGGCVVA